MTPNVTAHLRALVEKLIAERNLVSRDELPQLVQQAVLAALGITSSNENVSTTVAVAQPIRETATNTATPTLVVSPITVRQQVQPAPTPRVQSTGVRGAKKTEDEKRAERAAYQRMYRAKQKDLLKGHVTPAAPRAQATPTVQAPAQPKAPPIEKPKNGSTGIQIEYVPVCDLGEL